MPRFLDELKDKAQSAINATPLKAYVPQVSQSSSSNAGTGSRSYAFDAIQHQIRTFQVQYGSTSSKDVRQLQLIITGQKGIVLDLHGCLTSTLASAIDSSRGPMKALRDAEVQLQPKRNIRNGYEVQISNLKNAHKPGTEAKIRELESMLKQAEARDESLEKEIELLKRKAIAESEAQKWEAIREYGEKLVLLSQAAKPIIDVLPPIPPTQSNPYTGAATTAAVRATLQKALDQYRPGNTILPLPTGVEKEPRSFGETHAKELSRISSVADHKPPPSRASSPPVPSPDHKSSTESLPPPSRTSSVSSPAIDPRTLNNAPAPIPIPVSESSSPQAGPMAKSTELPPSSELSADAVPADVPTVAETGVPVVAGKDGPGPSSGSLAGGHRPSQSSTASVSPFSDAAAVPKPGLNDKVPSASYESAEEEKARLQREDRERLLHSESSSAQAVVNAAPAAYESAEDEKQRLQREERERLLNSQATSTSQSEYPGLDTERGEEEDDSNVPPPYEEPK